MKNVSEIMKNKKRRFENQKFLINFLKSNSRFNGVED